MDRTSQSHQAQCAYELHTKNGARRRCELEGSGSSALRPDAAAIGALSFSADPPPGGESGDVVSTRRDLVLPPVTACT